MLCQKLSHVIQFKMLVDAIYLYFYRVKYKYHIHNQWLRMTEISIISKMEMPLSTVFNIVECGSHPHLYSKQNGVGNKLTIEIHFIDDIHCLSYVQLIFSQMKFFFLLFFLNQPTSFNKTIQKQFIHHVHNGLLK